jgi:hypothetical protein
VFWLFAPATKDKGPPCCNGNVSFSLGMLQRGFLFGFILLFVWASTASFIVTVRQNNRVTLWYGLSRNITRGLAIFWVWGLTNGSKWLLFVIWFSVWTDQGGRGHSFSAVANTYSWPESLLHFSLLLLLLYVINLCLIAIKYVLFWDSGFFLAMA